MGSIVPLVATAIVIGSSDGIGLARTRRLLAAGRSVTGVRPRGGRG
ncbi:hypothetical protein WEI85_14215 [Actinomycetes bacterium KLBMP 9797]